MMTSAPELRATFETILSPRGCAPSRKIGTGAAHGVNLRRSGEPRSADFQSAVSRISNPQTLQVTERADSLKVLPIGNRRYSRLETCATRAAQGPSRSADFQSAVSRISNLQTLQVSERVDPLKILPIGNRRYSRLETCATDRSPTGP